MTIDYMVPNSLDDIYGPGAEDASYVPEATYIVRVDDGRVVEMIGMQDDLDKILAAMKAVRSEPAEQLTGIDYVLGTEDRGVAGSLDLLNLMHPETAGLAMCQAITKAWPDAGQERLDLLDLARQYVSGHDYPERHTFLSVFSTFRSKYSPAIWSALVGATESR